MPEGATHLLANGTYRDVWNRRNGRWTYQPSTGVFRFTGILQNGARAVYTFDKYRPERIKGMIEFTWESDLKRWCYHD